jgi:hypothetical protein
MAGRHQAELAVEFAQGRLWQALDEGLAVKPFCAFVSDQQMSLGLKTVLERLASDKSDVVSLYAAPI